MLKLITKLPSLLALLIQGLAAGLIIIAGIFFVGERYGYLTPIKPFIVMSGSMEPAIETGSVALVAPKEFGYAKGDIITFENNGQMVTHRIQSLQQENGQIIYQTKGDANSNPDPNTITPEKVVGSVFLSVPKVGYAAHFAKEPQGFILLVIVPVTIIIYEELKTIGRELKKFFKKIIGDTSEHQVSPSTNSQPTSTHQPPSNADIVSNQTPAPAKTPYQVVAVSQPATTQSSGSASKSAKRVTKEKSGGWLNPFVIVPAIGALIVGIGATGSYFMDIELSAGNILGAAAEFTQNIQSSTIYQSTQFTCEVGATETETPVGQLEVTQGDTQLALTITLENAPANTSYDFWVNQHPDECPLDEPTQTDAFSTDGSGNANYSFNHPKLETTTDVWVSVVGGGQVYRSSAISL